MYNAKPINFSGLRNKHLLGLTKQLFNQARRCPESTIGALSVFQCRNVHVVGLVSWCTVTHEPGLSISYKPACAPSEDTFLSLYDSLLLVPAYLTSNFVLFTSYFKLPTANVWRLTFDFLLPIHSHELEERHQEKMKWGIEVSCKKLEVRQWKFEVWSRNYMSERRRTKTKC